MGLTPDEKKLYLQLFRTLDSDGTGIVTGDKARATFEKLGLPPSILGEIWQLADQGNLGFLTQLGFCYAMRLIGYTQLGQHPTAQLAENPGPLPKFASLPPLLQQPTNGLFMAASPGASHAAGPIGTSVVLPVSAADYQRFKQLFVRTSGLPTAELGGDTARDIFLKAKLPTPVLGQIWSLVDRNNSGRLPLGGFVVAMHLIQGLLGGTIGQLPPALPENVWQLVEKPDVSSRQTSYGSVSSQQTAVKHPVRESGLGAEWKISAAQKHQFDGIFEGLDKDKSGQLAPDAVAGFLMTSKLNQQDLASVWDLLDIQNTGVFTKVEFSIALYLVNRKVSGDPLPNIVPHSLIESIKQLDAQQPPAAPVVAPIAPQKTHMDDLADIFSSLPAPVAAAPPKALLSRQSSSDLTPPSELPRVRSNLTGSFKPTSTFGQTLLQTPTLELPKEDAEGSLIGDDVLDASEPAPTPKEQKSVNYDALRSVPPPPKKEERAASSFLSYRSTPPLAPANRGPVAPANNDLLADTDPEVSGRLSQATSDIANVLTQIRSLTTQTTGLHEKKSRAEQELARILATKKEIEAKLRQLRTSYENEVKQVEQVDADLAAAKEETEALRSQLSISEAKLNHVSAQFHEKQQAVEALQKDNASLKEKIGNLNAEIVELESQTAQKNQDHQALANQVLVRKSQVQVAIVKTEELKAKIVELEKNNERLQAEHTAAEEREAAAQKEREELAERQEKALKFQPVSAPKKTSSATTGAVAAGLAVVGAVAGALGSHLLPLQEEETPKDTRAISEGEKKTTEPENQVFGSPGVPSHEIKATEPENRALGHESEASSSEIKPEELESAAKETQNRAIPPKQPALSALVDEVQEKPSTDMTGVDDVEQVNPEGSELPSKTEDINDRFPDINETNTQYSVANSYRNTEGETPVTSPSGLDFQFPQGSTAGVVGGLVGMPGVLVGVQRTDLLTSSVQNNAALSVRDDNIDDISDRETVDEAPKSATTEVQEDAEGDKLSSGVESFEIVNAEDARGAEGQYYQDRLASSSAEIPGSFAHVVPSLAQNPEFPPIRELDYDESSSDESQDTFDDAVDNFGKNQATPASAQAPKDAFDDAFDDLQPAKAEKNEDLFDDFDNLEAAKEDNGAEDDFGDREFQLLEGFTDLPLYNAPEPTFPDFNDSKGSSGANDEWEQLFAGFGNAQAAPAEAPAAAETLDSRHLSIQELVGMGFDEKTAVAALTREDWDLESATNYLLDNA